MIFPPCFFLLLLFILSIVFFCFFLNFSLIFRLHIPALDWCQSFWCRTLVLDTTKEILESCYMFFPWQHTRRRTSRHAWRVRETVHVMSFNLYNTQLKIQHSGEQHYGPEFYRCWRFIMGGRGHPLFCSAFDWYGAFSGVEIVYQSLFMSICEIWLWLSWWLLLPGCYNAFLLLIHVLLLKCHQSVWGETVHDWGMQFFFSTRLQYYHV